MKTIKLLPFLFLAVLSLTACASGRGGTEEETRPTILEVDNRSTFLMTIYLVRESGERRRLGQARSLDTTFFTLPRTMVFGITPLRVQADPVGSNRAPISNEVNVAPGDTIVMVIPPSEDLSPR